MPAEVVDMVPVLVVEIVPVLVVEIVPVLANVVTDTLRLSVTARTMGFVRFIIFSWFFWVRGCGRLTGIACQVFS